MKKTLERIIMAFVAVLVIAGCREKKETNVIITTRPVETVKKDTVEMQKVVNENTVKWKGAEYNVCVTRQSDKSLPLTEDENETKYYDNKISMVVTHADGTVFINKMFTKADFKGLVADDFYKKKALVGLVFDKVDGNCLKFAASVGSPDRFSDDFIPFELTVTPSGEVSIKLSEQNLVDTTPEDSI